MQSHENFMELVFLLILVSHQRFQVSISESSKLQGTQRSLESRDHSHHQR